METPNEEMTVDLELDDGTKVSCEVLTILEVDGKDYIALMPVDADDDSDEDIDVWFYEFKENPDDENAEPELIYIEDDEVYEAVADKFDEYLDTLEFEEGEE